MEFDVGSQTYLSVRAYYSIPFHPPSPIPDPAASVPAMGGAETINHERMNKDEIYIDAFPGAGSKSRISPRDQAPE